MTLYLGNNLISGVAYPTEPTRNLGQIIESIVPLTDAGLHLLDGALINGSGIYSAFVAAIADLVTTYPDLFETEANWQTAVTTYGVCGKFVYDSVNNTVRLPKITGKLEGTTDVSALGDLAEQYVKLPNITGYFSMKEHHGALVGMASEGGAIYGSSYGAYTRPDGGEDTGSGANRTVNLDASRSSSVYSGDGTDTKIHEQAIKCYYYIVIATSTKTDIQVDIDEIATDLNGKADVDLSNVTDTANILMAHNAMLSFTYDDLTLGASGTVYTAPADGYVWLSKYAGVDFYYVEIYVYVGDTSNLAYSVWGSDYRTSPIVLLIPVKKGARFGVSYNATGTTNFFRFIYAQGSESEAS